MTLRLLFSLLVLSVLSVQYSFAQDRLTFGLTKEPEAPPCPS